MSNNKDINKIEPKFNEAQAYEELRMIFVIAIETQNFDGIEERISAWEKKYPLAEFVDPEIIRKVKAILNKDFLSRLIGDYLAAKILHEKEKQQKYYNDLKEIIDSARKNKDYKNAQKQIVKWKSRLSSEGLSLYSFDKFYRAKMCTLLLIPSKELKNQEEAISSLKQIKDESSSLSSEDYSKSISDWQNKYSLNNFPESLKNELNDMTVDALKSISEKRNEENAINEVQKFISVHSNTMPMDSLAVILSKYDYTHFSSNAKLQIEDLSKQALSLSKQLLESISVQDKMFSSKQSTTAPQFTALNSLKTILNNSSHDTTAILNWIYTNRKINFSEFARDEIIKQFTNTGYKIPVQGDYSIPSLTSNVSPSQLENLKESVILNYLGIISQGNSLSKIGKKNVSEIYSTSEEKALATDVTKRTITLPVFNNIATPTTTQQENSTTTISKDEEKVIYNIFAEDLIANPLIACDLSSSKSVVTVLAEDTVENEIPSSEPEKIVEVTVPVEQTEAKAPTQFEGIKENGASSNVEEAIPPHSLTLEDQKNVETIVEETTYITVFHPILKEVLSYRQPVSRENKFQENSLQKNNGF